MANGGQYNVSGAVPRLGQLAQYNVNRPDMVEAVWAPFYHYQAYPAAGTTSLTFFQTPVGQAGTTLADTNMRAAGQIPRPQEFLVVGIQVYFHPVNAIYTTGAAAVASTASNWNNTNLVLESQNWLNFHIGSKDYITDGPITKFPPQFGLTGVSGMATTAATTNNNVDYARSQGRYYAITPLKIPASQNFDVTINWETVQAATDGARIGVILDGYLYRLSQ